MPPAEARQNPRLPPLAISPTPLTRLPLLTRLSTLTVVSAGNTPDNAISKGYDKFAELVKEYSGGNITADVYYGSDMGSLSACVDGVFQGTLDIVSCGPSYISGYVPAVQVFELPFVFGDAEQARKTLDAEPGQKISHMSTALAPSSSAILSLVSAS